MAEEARDMEIARPLELFDLSQLPVRNDLVEMVQERSFLPAQQPKKQFKHTGKIIIRKMLNDEELCIGICTAIVAKVSARLIGLRYGISPKSVVAIREAMEERGELAPVRTRIVRLVDQVTEVGLETVLDDLLAGKVSGGQAWIPALASVDKREQMSVGMVPGTERTRASVTTEQVLAEHALAIAGLKAPDSESTGKRTQPVAAQCGNAPQDTAATGPATGPKALPAASGLTIDLPATPAPATVPQPQTGGRGVAIPARPTEGRGDAPGNSNL